MAWEIPKTQTRPSPIREAFWYLYLLLSGITFAALLIGVLFLWAVAERVPTLDERGERENYSHLYSQLMRQPKHLNIKAINGGNWTLACLLGGLADRTGVSEKATNAGIELDQEALEQMVGPFKGGATLIYVTPDGLPHWLRLTALHDQLGYYETICVEPDQPIFKLPTELALQTFNKRADQDK